VEAEPQNGSRTTPSKGQNALINGSKVAVGFCVGQEFWILSVPPLDEQLSCNSSNSGRLSPFLRPLVIDVSGS